MKAVHSLRGAIPPLGVVAGKLPVRGRREAVHRVRSPELAEVPEDARRKLPFRVVRDAGEVVCPNVRSAPDVERSDLDVVGVDQQEELLQLAHHGRGLGGKVGQNPDDKLVVLVE